jgi:hypothetical protein
MTIDLGLVLGVVLFIGVVIFYFHNENKELSRLLEELKSLTAKDKKDLLTRLENQIKSQEEDVAGLVEKKLASILRSETLHGGGGNLADKLAEHLIALLGKPGSNFSNQFAESLAVVLADKIVLPAELISGLVKQAMPTLDRKVREKVEQLADSDIFDDPEQLADSIKGKLLETVLSEPQYRAVILPKLAQAAANNIDSAFEQLMEDDSDILYDWVKDHLPSILNAELANPESNFRARLLEAAVDDLVTRIENA